MSTELTTHFYYWPSSNVGQYTGLLVICGIWLTTIPVAIPMLYRCTVIQWARAKSPSSSSLVTHRTCSHTWRFIFPNKVYRQTASLVAGLIKDHAKTGKASFRQPSLSNTLQSGQKSTKWQHVHTGTLWCYCHIKYQYWISHTAQH